jgi:hypothetical protein
VGDLCAAGTPAPVLNFVSDQVGDDLFANVGIHAVREGRDQSTSPVRKHAGRCLPAGYHLRCSGLVVDVGIVNIRWLVSVVMRCGNGDRAKKPAMNVIQADFWDTQ